MSGWLAANTLAGTVFVALSTGLGVKPPQGAVELIAKLLLFGAIFGLVQWFVLRRYYDISWAWITAPIIGALAFVFGALGGGLIALVSVSRPLILGVAGAMAGGFIGIVQAVLLRPRLKQPLPLVLSTAFAGSITATYWVDALGSPEAPYWGAFGGFLYGLATGVGLLVDRLGTGDRGS